MQSDADVVRRDVYVHFIADDQASGTGSKQEQAERCLRPVQSSRCEDAAIAEQKFQSAVSNHCSRINTAQAAIFRRVELTLAQADDAVLCSSSQEAVACRELMYGDVVHFLAM